MLFDKSLNSVLSSKIEISNAKKILKKVKLAL
ncbi:hypothetical protein JOD96_002530 [Flavobacterium sp. 1355]|nr:hypothetical protein [Flavobacterium sp. 1355]